MSWFGLTGGHWSYSGHIEPHMGLGEGEIMNVRVGVEELIVLGGIQPANIGLQCCSQGHLFSIHILELVEDVCLHEGSSSLNSIFFINKARLSISGSVDLNEIFNLYFYNFFCSSFHSRDIGRGSLVAPPALLDILI